VTNFTPFETLTAAALNAAFGEVTPGTDEILTGDGSGNAVDVQFGTGITLTVGTLEVQWQSGTVAALGSGISLSGGTLSATGTGGTVTSVHTTGAGIAASPATITTVGTLAVEWNAGTVTALGSNLTLTGGTLDAPPGGVTSFVISASPYLNSGTISTTGTITAATIADSRVLANVSGGVAIPSATPFAGIHATAGTLVANWNAGTVTALGSNLSLTGGTLDAPPGGVTTIVAGTGLSGGTITSTGTIAIASIADARIFANVSGSPAAPSATPYAGIHVTSGSLVADWNSGTVSALGSGVSLVGGTLSATGTGGSVTDVETGAGLSGGPITTTGTIVADWHAGTVAALGSGISLTTGTLSATGTGGTVTNVATGTGLTGGPITTTGTILLASITAATVMANSGTASAAPSSTPIGGGLTFNSGTLTSPSGTVTKVSTGTGVTGGDITSAGTISLATRTASTLMGNPGTAAATPSDIVIGSGVTLSTTGTLSAAGTGGSVTSVVVDASPYLNAGTITTTGTVSAATLAANSLLANSGTAAAVPTAIAIGDGLNINSGTISVLNSGTLVTAAGSNQATAQTITADIAIAVTVAASTGLQLKTTPAAFFQQLIVNAGANTLSVYPASGAQIGSAGTNAAVSIVTGGNARFIAQTGSQWVTA